LVTERTLSSFPHPDNPSPITYQLPPCQGVLALWKLFCRVYRIEGQPGAAFDTETEEARVLVDM